MKSDLLDNPHVKAAVYFTDLGHFLFKYKKDEGFISKSLRTREVSAAFTLEGEDSGWIKAGIQRVGFNALGDWFVYFMPGCKVTVTLGKSEAITVPIPSTLLVGVNQAHYLLAVKGKTFDPMGQLFHAPFPNVHPDGKICWGKNEKPKVEANSAEAVWSLFFNSPFNGDLVQNKSKKFQEDVRKQLKALVGESTFPVKSLVQKENQIDGWLRRKIEERA